MEEFLVTREMPYGQELILDLHNCKNKNINRVTLEEFLIILCEKIDMQRADLHFWDFEDDPEQEATMPDHLKGHSLCQFIRTSSIVIHEIPAFDKVFINLFTCKPFDAEVAKEYIREFFEGEIAARHDITRI